MPIKTWHAVDSIQTISSFKQQCRMIKSPLCYVTPRDAIKKMGGVLHN